jgi:hypothetical protein
MIIIKIYMELYNLKNNMHIYSLYPNLKMAYSGIIISILKWLTQVLLFQFYR